MAEFSVKTNMVRETADAHERLLKELDHIQQSVQKISGSLVIKTVAAAGIKNRLGSLAGRIEDQKAGMRGMKNALDRVAWLYEEAEKNICGYTEGETKTSNLQTSRSEEAGSSFWSGLTNLFEEIAGNIGKILAGLFSPITTIWSKLASYVEGIIGKGDVTNSQPSVTWNTEEVSGIAAVIKGTSYSANAAATDGAAGEKAKASGDTSTSSTTASGATRYKQPEYTQKNLAPDANGIYGPFVYHRDGSLGRVYEWNTREGKDLSCTYYTLRKLNEQGLSYPCVGGPGNGSKWYANFDHESGLPNYGGNDALREVANNLTLPQENIIVSFDNDPSGKGWGHVLLIDEIYKNGDGIVSVRYRDNYPNITTLNGNNPPQNKTLEDFMSYYNKYNGNMNGAVVIGAGN